MSPETFLLWSLAFIRLVSALAIRYVLLISIAVSMLLLLIKAS